MVARSGIIQVMKDRRDAILHSRQAAYLESLLPPRDPVLADMERRAAADNIPISDPEVGHMLAILATALQPRLVLEIGTAIGYGTLCLARGAPNARVITVDTDPERLAAARSDLERAGVADRVDLRQGEALAVLPTLDGPFDLVYIDAVKSEYSRYLELLVPRLPVGGLVVVDNLLWKGWVADPAAASDEDENAAALRAFNAELMSHPHLRSLVLPLGDGLGVAVKLAA